MSSEKILLQDKVHQAVNALNAGGVVAYPTEYCFGLGCDPLNIDAIQSLLKIKNRQAEQGVILIASSVEQIEKFVDLKASPLIDEILASWPGPNTWILPAHEYVTSWVKGRHQGVAVRVTANHVSKNICQEFGGAIVSTSANRHGQPALLDAQSVINEMGNELSYVFDESVDGATMPSSIRDGLTGKQLR